MKKPEPQAINEKARNAISKLKGVEVRGPEELADFLKKENAQFSARDLTAFGYILATRFGRYGSMFYVPEWLAGVFSAFVEGASPRTICDPWAGVGFLIGILREASKAQTAIALTPNQGEMTLGKVLVPEADWQVGEPLRLLVEGKKELDVIASILPMNARSHEPLKLTLSSGDAVELADDLANLILVASSLRLSASGVGLFVVTPSFFFSSRSVFNRFSDLGLGIEAAFALPSGTFAPHTNIQAYFVIVRRKPLTRMFVAQLSADTNTNLQIIGNLRQECEGGSLELGRFVSPGTFKGIGHLRAAETFALAERRFGAPAVKLDELATAINLGRPGDKFSFQSLGNSIFVPLIGNSDIMESLSDLTLKPQNYAQVVIAPTRSNARFVARFLNSEFGKQLREQSKTGFIPKLNKQTLKELRVFVPDLQTQRRMLEIEARMTAEQNTLLGLQNELGEFRRELWSNPRAASSVEQQLSGLSKRLGGGLKEHTAERLDQWFETLPFPLASILRAWQATESHDFRTKHKHLLDFFEGTAEFVSVILLSAFSSNEALFGPHKQKLAEAMQKQNLSFQRATFGTWKLVVEYLGKQTRELLSENGKKPEDAQNDRALCADIFSDPSRGLPEALARKELAAILSTTNKMRNDWSGHSGVVGQEESQIRNEQLLAEVQKLRGALADIWAETQLVRGLHGQRRRDLYENEVAVLMGSHTEFRKENRTMTTDLDVERLYLLKKDSGRPLELIPLIQFGPSPPSAKNACYFFSRLERDGARFISYHFTDKPELTGQFADAEDAIKALTEF